MNQADKARARDAYVQWKRAGDILRNTGNSKPLTAFAEQHGDWLEDITQSAREADPRLNRVSMFKIIADMLKTGPPAKVIDS